MGKANEAAVRPLSVQRQSSQVSSVAAERFHKSERPLRTPVQQWAPASVYREGRVRKSSARRSRVGDVVVMHGHTVHRAPAYQSQTLRTLLFVPFQPRHLSRRALSAPAQVTDVLMACYVEDERGTLRSLSVLVDHVIAHELVEKLVLQHHWTSMSPHHAEPPQGQAERHAQGRPRRALARPRCMCNVLAAYVRFSANSGRYHSAIVPSSRSVSGRTGVNTPPIVNSSIWPTHMRMRIICQAYVWIMNIEEGTLTETALVISVLPGFSSSGGRASVAVHY